MRRYLKYVAIALAAVLLIAAALLLLKTWETKRGRYPMLRVKDGVVTYRNVQYQPREHIETFLVLGLDRGEADGDAAEGKGGVQADFLMLFVFDNEGKTCAAVHINRDTIVKVNRLGIDGSRIGTARKQIALAYNYAYDDIGRKNCRNTADSVSDLLLGVGIDHYLSLTMSAVPALNDLVGGVEVEILDDFSGSGEPFTQGETVTLTGETALRYIRARGKLKDSTNLSRMRRQRQYINALYDKASDRIREDDAFAVEALDSLLPYLVYDTTEARLRELVRKFDEYEFTGIREIEGESKVGKRFMEFYPDEVSVQDVVIDLFYVPKNEGK